MPECAPVSTHPGQEGLREAGSGAKTGLEEPHGQRSPVTCLALDAKRALCSPSLVVPSLLRELLGMPDGTAASFEAESLSEAMPALRRAFPKLAPHVWDETGALRKHVQVYVGEWNVRWSDVPDDVWHDGACVRVAMAVSGG